MSRTLTSTALAAMFAQETAEAVILLVTIEHAGLSPAARVCTAGEDVISRGNTYYALPFEFALPDDSEDSPPTAKLRLDNVERELIDAIRSISTPPTVTMEIILASDPDTVEVQFPNLELVNVTYDSMVIEGELAMNSMIQEPYPGFRYVPSFFAGLF